MLELGKHRGKYIAVYYEDGVRKRRSLGTTDEAVARTRLAEIEHQRTRLAVTRGHSVAQLFDMYIKDKEIDTTKSPTTINSMRRSAKNTGEHFGHLEPHHITKELVHKFTEERGQKVKRATVVLELSYLRSCLRWAKNNKLLTEVPYIPVPSPPPPRDHYLTKEDFSKVLQVCHTPHLRLFIILALTTAARCQAILELTWDRVDLDKGLIDLRNPSKPATRKGRQVVPLNTSALSVLSEAHRHRTCNHVIEYHSHGISDIRHSIQVVSQKAGVKFTPHVLRHTAAVWMAEHGVPMPEISQYLGHKNTQVTERVYARYSPSYLRKAADALEIPNPVASASLRRLGGV